MEYTAVVIATPIAIERIAKTVKSGVAPSRLRASLMSLTTWSSVASLASSTAPSNRDVRPSRREAVRELTLASIDRHSGRVDELDVGGVLTFAERILPRASDLWVQASLNQRQRFQQLFFPDGIAFDGNRFIGTGVTAPAFSYLREISTGNEGLVDLTRIELVTS